MRVSQMSDFCHGSGIPWWALCLCLAVCLLGIFNRDLWTPDEPRVAAISLEMSRTGNLVVPHLAGEPFIEKPPLYFAIAAGFIRILGPLVGNTAAIRLTSAVWGLGALGMTFLLARRQVYFSGRQWFCLLAGLFTAGAFLSKGLIGPIFIAVAWIGMIIPWLTSQWREKRKLDLFILPHIISLLSFVLLAGSWMILLRGVGGQDLWHEWF